MSETTDKEPSKLVRIVRATRPYRFTALVVLAVLIIVMLVVRSLQHDVVVLDRSGTHSEFLTRSEVGEVWPASTFHTGALIVDTNSRTATLDIVTNGDDIPFNTLKGTNSDGGNLWIGGGGAGTIGAIGNTNLGAENVAVGHFAARDATTMFDSVIIGAAAGRGITTGADLVAVGRSALQGDGVTPVTGHHNTAVGVNAMGAQATTAEDSVAVGLDSLEFITTGFQNTCVGYESCAKVTTGFSNTTMGSHAFENATTAHDNVTVGLNSLRDCTTCDHNTTIGRGTGGGITTGQSNTILGAGVTGLTAGLSNNVIIADGDGNIRVQVDNTGLVTLSGAASMSTHLIHNVVDPVSAQDAATKNYVDSSTSGAITGTTNTIAKFTGTHAVGNSGVTDDGTIVATSEQIQFGPTVPSSSQKVLITDASATDTAATWIQTSSTAHVGSLGNNEMIGAVYRIGDTFDTTTNPGHASALDIVVNSSISAGGNSLENKAIAAIATCPGANCSAWSFWSSAGIMQNDGPVNFQNSTNVQLGNAVQRFTVLPTTPTLITPQLDLGIIASVDGYEMHIKNTATGVSATGIALEGDTAVTASVAPQLVLARGAGGAFTTFGLLCNDNGAASCLAAAAANDIVLANYGAGQTTWIAQATGSVILGTTAAPTATFDASHNTTLAGTLDMGTHLIHNVVDPVSAQDAATKNYVDTSTSGAVNAAVSGTTNTVAKFTSTNVVGNGLLTDDGTTVALPISKQFQIGTGITTYRRMQITGATATDEEMLWIEDNATGHTGTGGVNQAIGIVVRQQGTSNATPATATATGIDINVTQTRSAGANALTNTAVLANASGGQTNYAYFSSNGLMSQAGDASFGNVLASGTLGAGATTISSLTNTGTSTLGTSGAGNAVTVNGTIDVRASGVDNWVSIKSTATGGRQFYLESSGDAGTQPDSFNIWDASAGATRWYVKNGGDVVTVNNQIIGAGAQILSGGAPSVDHGSLGTGSTNWSGNVTGIGANTSVTLTYSGAFANRSRCIAITNSTSVVLETIVVTNSASAPVFNCLAIATGVAANCDDFTYECIGQ